MKHNYKLLAMLLIATTISFAQQTVFIDVGDSFEDLQTSGNYNNMENEPSDPNTIADLINDAGATTGFGFTTHDNFEWFNTAGTDAPTGDATIFEPQTTRDSYFGHDDGTNNTGGFTFSGLDDAKYYSFEIFASRMDATDNRETLYTIAGTNTETGTLDAANNTSNTVKINNVQSTNGNITIDVTWGPNNTNGSKYYYLGAIKMDETQVAASIQDDILANGGLQVYPNPVGDQLNINYILDDNSKSSVLIYDITGRLIYNVSSQMNQAGTYSYKWNRLNNNGKRVVSGVYFLTLKTDNTSVTKKLILK